LGGLFAKVKKKRNIEDLIECWLWYAYINSLHVILVVVVLLLLQLKRKRVPVLEFNNC